MNSELTVAGRAAVAPVRELAHEADVALARVLLRRVLLHRLTVRVGHPQARLLSVAHVQC